MSKQIIIAINNDLPENSWRLEQDPLNEDKIIILMHKSLHDKYIQELDLPDDLMVKIKEIRES